NPEDMITPKNVAWLVRKIIDSRKVLEQVQFGQGTISQKLIHLENRGRFQINMAYAKMLPLSSLVLWKSITTSLHVHPRFKFNIWLAVQQRLATMDRLQRIGIQ
ncbi:hypothetical protein HAX54_021015, partial [Datura stramonium]|nr:hypothetical protein [Datura stramonium]